MVRALSAPVRPLPSARFRWAWTPRPPAAVWQWCRVYHRGVHTPDGVSFRSYGPLYRFDHHHAATPPREDEAGREILYVGEDLATSACEVFGEAGVATICPNYRVSIVAPTGTVSVFDLAERGAAMAIGALPSLAVGNETRALTQLWARAIYEDKPAGRAIYGVRYLSAYNGGFSLALWDCADRVEIVRDSAGEFQDLPLSDPRVLNRLQVQLRQRRIAVTTVAESDCAQCRRESASHE